MKKQDYELFIEKLNHASEELDPKGVAAAAGYLVNSFSIDRHGFVGCINQYYPLAKQNFTEMAVAWVHELYDMKLCSEYDGRNEFAVFIGADLDDCLARFAPGINYRLTKFGRAFAEQFRREHRTLQQSFSSIVFLFLSSLLTAEELRSVDESMSHGRYWRESLPMI